MVMWRSCDSTHWALNTHYRSPSLMLQVLLICLYSSTNLHTHTLANSFVCFSHSLGPPSPPRNLLYTLKQSTLILEWTAPTDTGGRVDVSYNVSCQRCVSGPREHCEPCGANVGFVPQQSGLSGRTVTVLNLLPSTNYTFSVEARNGVSDLLPNKRFYTHVNISISLPGNH